MIEIAHRNFPEKKALFAKQVPVTPLVSYFSSLPSSLGTKNYTDVSFSLDSNNRPKTHLSAPTRK